MATGKKAANARNKAAAKDKDASESITRSMSLGVPSAFKKKKQLTFGVRKIANDETIFAEILSPIRVSAQKGGRKNEEGDKDMEPANIVEILEYTDQNEIANQGEIMVVIVNKVLGDTLQENYPDNSYVGKKFAIKKFGKAAGKRYNTFAISEIE